jgi:type VI secretion system protein ImpM
MQTQSAAGFYGKLPCKGDFLQRRVSQEFVDAWDAWLQQCLVASREQLQERWLDAYLTSPVWRFALADGVCGSGAYAGVMLPSVDRVGRYFPLTLVTHLHTEDCLLEVAGDAGLQWFDSAAALALGALQAHDLDLTVFDEEVAGLGAPSGELQVSESAYLRELMQNGQFARRPGQWQVPLARLQALQHAANVFASRELERTMRPLALWWTDGSDLVAPSWLCSRGLPSVASFAAMIAGDWQAFGWESLGPPQSPRQPVELQAASPAPVEIVVRHSAIVRRPASEPRVHFVSRPEHGLWAVTYSEGDGLSGVGAAQAMADSLHDVSVAGSLASLAEEVRRQLEAVRARMIASEAVGAVVFLARANECAVVHMGSAQAIRLRSGAFTTIEGASPGLPADGDVFQSLHPPGDGSLLDLLTGPVTGAGTVSVSVHYDTLAAGDAWLLAGARLFDASQLTTLPATLEDGLPLMLLTAAFGAAA